MTSPSKPKTARLAKPPTASARTDGFDEGLRARMWPWVLRLVWSVLPFTVGAALSAALDPHSRPVRLTALALAWAWWGVGLLATLVAHPLGLVALRVGAAMALAAALWSTGGASTTLTVLALAAACVAVAATTAADTGHLCVNGPAYPNERRYLLRPPAQLLLGPIPVTAALLGTGTVVGPLMIACRQWVLGAILTVAGFGAAVVSGRALYAICRRFLVFVPAGLVVHDPDSLRDPVLFRRQVIEGIGTAMADSDSLDLTANVPGIALEVLLTEKIEITRVRNSRDPGETGKTARFLVVPTMPGRFLAAASARRFPLTD